MSRDIHPDKSASCSLRTTNAQPGSAHPSAASTKNDNARSARTASLTADRRSLLHPACRPARVPRWPTSTRCARPARKSGRSCASVHDTFDFESREMVARNRTAAESLPLSVAAVVVGGLRPPLRIADPPSAADRESTSPYQRDDGVSDDEAFTAFANRFAALSSPTRVKLAVLLCRHPAGTESGRVLAASVGLAETTVSHHLRLLRRAGLIDSQRRGMSVYHFARPELRHLYRTLVSGSDWK